MIVYGVEGVWGWYGYGGVRGRMMVVDVASVKGREFRKGEVLCIGLAVFGTVLDMM